MKKFMIRKIILAIIIVLYATSPYCVIGNNTPDNTNNLAVASHQRIIKKYKVFFEYLTQQQINYSMKNNRIYIGTDLDLSGSKILQLPDNLSVSGNLMLSESQITTLPNNLSVSGYLDLSETKITNLPKNLSAGWSLYLTRSEITQLPNNLAVRGNLDLSYTKLSTLPDNLSVGGNLYLSQTNIKRLPEHLSVGGNLYLDVEKINNIAYRQNIDDDNTTLFAVFVNGEIQISVPKWNFLGNIDAFNNRTCDCFTKINPKEFREAAKECIEELTAMREKRSNHNHGK